MTNAILETIMRRRSIRSYLPGPVEREKLQAVAEAGQYAPNGSGGEAWHFTVVQDAGIIGRLDRLAKDAALQSGLPWLQALGRDDNFHSIHGAPAVILLAAEEQNITAVYDISAATQNMLLAAEALGLGSCWGYFVTQAFLAPGGEGLRAELGIPEGYKVYTSVMLGYKDGETPPAPPRKPGAITMLL